ncbi:MAG: hypothetical protein WCP03_01140 [Candidatus Saccharibacteria bacterium]
MNKRIKLEIILALSVTLLVTQIALFLTNTKGQTPNYWWAAGLSLLAIVSGSLGLITAKNWSWLKSGVGQAVFFISLGTIIWGIGQAGWTYFLFKDPNIASPSSRLLDIFFMASIPLWFYGVLKLSQATGAKYGLKKLSGKLLALFLALIMAVASYYFLVIVARGGFNYFDGQSVFDIFVDLGYSIGEGLIFTLALVVFGLSWKFLGGRFKYPIIAILAGFGLLYFADFAFSYLDGQGKYFNGDISDFLFLVAFTVLGVGLCMLDPTRNVKTDKNAELPIPDKAIYSD